MQQKFVSVCATAQAAENPASRARPGWSRAFGSPLAEIASAVMWAGHTGAKRQTRFREWSAELILRGVLLTFPGVVVRARAQ